MYKCTDGYVLWCSSQKCRVRHPRLLRPQPRSRLRLGLQRRAPRPQVRLQLLPMERALCTPCFEPFLLPCPLAVTMTTSAVKLQSQPLCDCCLWGCLTLYVITGYDRQSSPDTITIMGGSTYRYMRSVFNLDSESWTSTSQNWFSSSLEAYGQGSATLRTNGGISRVFFNNADNSDMCTYDVSAGGSYWSTMSPQPSESTNGACLTTNGDDKVYFMNGNGEFLIYDVNTQVSYLVIVECCDVVML